MMVQGIVQAVAGGPEKAFNTTYGPAYHLKLKMQDGQWYKYPFCKVDQPAPVSKGMHVGFNFTVEESPPSQPGKPPFINNIIDKKSFVNMGGGAMQPQQYQQPQQNYQQPQQQYQQQPQQQYGAPTPKHNWAGNEGMATGVAINNACLFAENLDQVMVLAAKIMIIQDEMIKFLEQGGHPQQIVDADPNGASGATQQMESPMQPAGGQIEQPQQYQQPTTSPAVNTSGQAGGMPTPPPPAMNSVPTGYSSTQPPMAPNHNMAGK